MRIRAVAALSLFCATFMLTRTASSEDVPVGQRAIDLMWDCQGRGQLYEIFSKLPQSKAFKDLDLLVCSAYLAGFTDAHAVSKYVGGGAFYCFPGSGLPAEQLIMVFLKWATDNPARLHESRRSAVISAFSSAFPCRK
jgi:hypothetical protein